MCLDFRSNKPVTINQLIDAGTRCGIDITKNILDKNTYTMTWDVDDYEKYATSVLTKPETQKAFRKKIKPRSDRFVMERDFNLVDGVMIQDVEDIIKEKRSPYEHDDGFVEPDEVAEYMYNIMVEEEKKQANNKGVLR